MISNEHLFIGQINVFIDIFKKYIVLHFNFKMIMFKLDVSESLLVVFLHFLLVEENLSWEYLEIPR